MKASARPVPALAPRRSPVTSAGISNGITQLPQGRLRLLDQTRSCHGVHRHRKTHDPAPFPRCTATHVDARHSRYVRWRTDPLVPTPYIETRSGKTHSRRADRTTNAFTGTIVGARTPRLGRCLRENPHAARVCAKRRESDASRRAFASPAVGMNRDLSRHDRFA